MHLTPFVQVDDVLFSTTRAELLRRKGQPLCRSINDVALEAFRHLRNQAGRPLRLFFAGG